MMTDDELKAVASPHVLIVGAGITGLLIAQGLKKAGVGYTIFDAETPGISRRREWTLGIHWSIPILENLLPTDLAARLSEAETNPGFVAGLDHTIQLYNSQTGEVLKTIPTPKLRRVSRKKLRALCMEGVEVLWGKTIDSVTYDSDGAALTARFTDGSLYHGDLLVGADGPKSKVREILLGVEKSRATAMEIVYNMSIVKYGDTNKALFVQSAHPQNVFGYNPNGIFSFLAIQDMPDPDKPETWTFQVGSSWLGQRDANLSNEERLKNVKIAASELSEPFRSANLWMPEDTIVNTDPIAYWVPIPFETHQGRITLCGDATHPLPPHRGQGLNHCILDASNFVAAVVKIKQEQSKKEELIEAYTEELIKRGGEEVNLSLKNALTVHDWKVFMESPLMKHGITKMS
ncbi:FAD/NAD(P)-binding domain-containing protein [Hyaloscypha variabilis F]|uniref:FAD/NAD(P)-binding domain-containing protein n=1 Tax=Hyaloscypha variabilis (strain UAMH 11265 / GT02V1 / F) TaxID=1149755 RepID=A0A2J6RF69_HYAVF|nr:FAD/NAD(P)-binding domain-containing protein [Hyaloscypha variabilis F]PMD37123.1 FAD/NAD(P)-binding domain-containing protein [Hyaloscypha variabilis F]